MSCLHRAASLAFVLAATASAPCLAQDELAKLAELTAAAHTCTPTGVAAMTSRIHVRCSAAAPGGIVFFAVPTSDANRAARMLAMFQTALAAGRGLTIFYDPADSSGVAYGCAASDCRHTTGAELW